MASITSFLESAAPAGMEENPLHFRSSFRAGAWPFRLLAVIGAFMLAPSETAAASEFVTPGGTDLAFVRTLLLILHVFGLVMGMGGAVSLDLFMMSYTYRQPVSEVTLLVLAKGRLLVSWGLTILCVSGAGFLILYFGTSAGKLENPKIWAKVMVVCILLLNGMWIHERLTPYVEERLGKPLLGQMPLTNALPILTMGAISIAGWMFAFILGMVRELNFLVSGQLLLAGYFVMVAGVLGVASLLHLIENTLAGRATRTIQDKLH